MDELRRINLDEVRKIALKEWEWARGHIQGHPNKQLTPSLLVVVGNPFEETTWKLHKIMFADFDERRFDAMRAIGTGYASRGEYVAAIVLTSEVWAAVYSKDAWEAHPENRIEPRLDPDRIEMLMTAAMTLDLKGVMINASFSRDDRGKPIFEEMILDSFAAKDETHDCIILLCFLESYAREVAQMRGL